MDERLRGLLSDDPDHIYSEEELDAIEAVDPALALRLERVQFLARQGQTAVSPEGPIDEAAVREAIDEARAILARDGGDIELVEVDHEHATVVVLMKGACAGCPNSVLDLRNVVERLVRGRCPGVARVVNRF